MFTPRASQASNSSRRKALLIIALPLLLTAVTMLWSTSRMLDGISRSVDAQEHVRARTAVRSAVDSILYHLGGMIVDNAEWDDAVSNAVNSLNREWTVNMWKNATSETNYNVTFVVRKDRSTLLAYRNGEDFEESAEVYFGPLLDKLVGTLADDPTTFHSTTTLAATKDGVLAVAAGSIVPNSDAVAVDGDSTNVLIFAHLLTPEDYTSISSQFGVDALSVMAGKNEESGGMVLTDTWGSPVATANWTDRHPGAAARNSYAASAFSILLALIAVMLPVSALHFRALDKLAASEGRARRDARADALTGLSNRLEFGERLAASLVTAQPSTLALLYIDLDGFKAVNDTYDHATGDRLLFAVAEGLKILLPRDALLARLGGDEFAVMLEGRDAPQRAEVLARHTLGLLKAPFNIDGRIICVGASIGIAEADTVPMDGAELMRRADIAMYESKSGGRNQYRWYRAVLDSRRQDSADAAAEMRDFIARRHFDVAYQPIVDSATRRITGVEALARWPKSSGRSLTPDVFIPIAEENGLIDGLGSLILETACRDMAQWQDIRLSVNVSPVQLNNPDFVENLRRTVLACGFDLRRLEVEFTETVLIRNTQRASEVIAALHDLGVTVSLDDFGTGFASVGYLRAFHFDKIKLDRSLTHAMLTDVQAQKVVQGTVLIAGSLSAEIIAEGVESEEEAQLMRLSGCHQLQGYYFGRPQAAAAIRSLLPASEMPSQCVTA